MYAPHPLAVEALLGLVHEDVQVRPSVPLLLYFRMVAARPDEGCHHQGVAHGVCGRVQDVDGVLVRLAPVRVLVDDSEEDLLEVVGEEVANEGPQELVSSCDVDAHSVLLAGEPGEVGIYKGYFIY